MTEGNSNVIPFRPRRYRPTEPPRLLPMGKTPPLFWHPGRIRLAIFLTLVAGWVGLFWLLLYVLPGA